MPSRSSSALCRGPARLRCAAAALGCLALLVAPALACSRERPPNVLLISIDDLRPDRLGAYGYARDTSPAIDSLARRGTVFENAFSAAPWTLPSHMSMMTSLYPSEHGINPTPTLRPEVRTLPVLPDRFVTLAERLREGGYTTAAFTNGTYVEGRLGFRQGFDRYLEVRPLHAVPLLQREVLGWLRAEPRRPFFVFLHAFEVHQPFAPPEASIRELGEEPPALRSFGLLEQGLVRRGEQEVTPHLLATVGLLYDAGIRYTDGLIAAVVAELEARGELDRTLIVLTSDHGEEFYEHGSFGHGPTLYDEVLRVPFVWSGPGVARGRRLGAPASLLDIMPTILDLLGFPLEGQHSGVSVAPLLDPAADPAALREAGAPRVLYAETRSFGGHRIAARRGSHKAILDLASGSLELYDLLPDPAETRDLSETMPSVARELRALLEAYRDARPAEAAPAEVLAIDDETRSQLRALGYEESDEPAGDPD